MKQIVFALGLVFGLQAVVSGAEVNFAAEGRKASSTPPTPPLPTNSVSQLFRQLLALSPQEREQDLAMRTPEARRVIAAKLSEFTPLPPAERELRLRLLQLRCDLLPLMHLSPTNRGARLAAIPEEERRLVEDRLREWDLSPPDLRKAILENEKVLRYIFPLDSGTTAQHPVNLRNVSQQEREQLERDMARWRAIPREEQERIFARTRRFFDLDEREKEKILTAVAQALAQAQREQLERTLHSLQQLPKPQRDLCMEGLSKFAQLTPQEQLQFLKNCERWQAMTPEQQKAMRAAVSRVPPMPTLPPMPQGLTGYPNLLVPLHAYRVSATNAR
jgi:hypothetical protein